MLEPGVAHLSDRDRSRRRSSHGRPRIDRLRPVTASSTLARLVRRPPLPLWLRVGVGLMLILGVFSLVGPPRVLGEGSANLEANGGKRALTEWRTSLYGNLLPRRTLFKVYAKAGEEIALGSSGVGVGAGDIVVWTPGQITAPLTVALPAPDFTCSASQPGLGAMTTRAQEVAGPTPAAGGYTPCIYTAATTGIYNVAFYGPVGRQQATSTGPPAPSPRRPSMRPRPAASRCGTSRCAASRTRARRSTAGSSPTTSPRSPAATARGTRSSRPCGPSPTTASSTGSTSAAWIPTGSSSTATRSAS